MTNDLADRLGFVDVDETLEQEFEARLADSSTLAFRVAFSILRQREDAEEVAQEALAKAYRTSGGCATAIGSGPGWCGSPGG